MPWRTAGNYAPVGGKRMERCDKADRTFRTYRKTELIITCGVSGAVQFAAGMDGAECIVAINTDAEAPIFKIANYCITEDLYRVVPGADSSSAGKTAVEGDAENGISGNYTGRCGIFKKCDSPGPCFLRG